MPSQARNPSLTLTATLVTPAANFFVALAFPPPARFR